MSGELTKTPMEPETYSVPVAARKLGVGRATMYRAVERREIPNIRIGARIVIPAWWVNDKLRPPSQ